MNSEPSGLLRFGKPTYNENEEYLFETRGMFELADMGKILIIIGVIIIVFGLVFTFWSRIPFLGQLPGDFSFQKGNISFFFPLVTSLVISLILTIIINIVIRIWK